jgi:hypothetical protein
LFIPPNFATSTEDNLKRIIKMMIDNRVEAIFGDAVNKRGVGKE